MIIMLFWLLVGHAVADYPLQGDFLSRAKNRRSPLDGVPWQIGLFMHALIHAGFVMLGTGIIWLALGELLTHLAIDDSKCIGKIGFWEDQILHVMCKLVWVLLAFGVWL